MAHGYEVINDMCVEMCELFCYVYIYIHMQGWVLIDCQKASKK
jgi:hypothetical protein